MRRSSANNIRVWPTLVGLGAVLTLAALITLVLASNGKTSVASGSTSTAQASSTAQVSSTLEVSDTPTLMYPPDKATAIQSRIQTQQAFRLTPNPPLTIYPPPSESGPTITPDLSYVPHQQAGAGVIITGTGSFPFPGGGWVIAPFNVWFEIPTGMQVYAGVTSDPTQGALAILTPQEDIGQPEVYLTPRKAGMVKVVDASGERLVLQSITGSDTFYFDVPTRQFVDSLSVTSVAPTVTPLPTFTASPTFVVPTLPPPPTAYPIASPSEATSAPTAQSTASY